jgi:hypothetical protein
MMEIAMKEFWILILALALAGGAASMVHTKALSPTSAVPTNYSGLSW